MNFIDASKANDHWDVVIVGTGFGSMFFAHKYLQNRPDDRVLFVELGDYKSWAWQIENRRNSDVPKSDVFTTKSHKPWDFTIGLGGSSNCWWGLTPRLHPSDFSIFTDTGASVDWPLSYNDLVPYFQEAEQIMEIAGPDDIKRSFPGSGPYPQPAHRLTTVDEMIIAGGDPYHFAVPNARASTSSLSRNRCCSTAACNLCPVGAKFMGVNDMKQLFSHPSVSICLNSRVTEIKTAGNVAQGIVFKHADETYEATGDLVVLGANAIQSPFIMLRSGIGGHGVGRYLGEKLMGRVEVTLDGIDHFDGGTAATAVNMGLVENNNRADYGAAAIYVENVFNAPGFRLEPGRWRQVLPLFIYVEDILSEENGVFDEGGDLPVVRFGGFSDYCKKGLDMAMAYIPEMLKSVPFEEVKFLQNWPTLGHVQGTTRMGTSIENSVVDRDLVHHEIRNLVVVGTSVFPTTGSVNPTLTASALSLRAAEILAA